MPKLGPELGPRLALAGAHPDWFPLLLVFQADAVVEMSYAAQTSPAGGRSAQRASVATPG
ncbi:MAG TPA: hypothetical protein VNX67_06745 [Solirubrobacteraceae bacterium]|nr:hypothetical protein [Solirubrobacteraceae bacterium]